MTLAMMLTAEHVAMPQPPSHLLGSKSVQSSSCLSRSLIISLTMEAVGLAASIITLISAATLTGATITRVWGLRGCPQSVTTSLNEVEDFKGVLLLVHNALSDLDYDNDQIRRLLDRAKIRLAAFDTYLKIEILREEAQVQDDERPKLKKRAKWKEVVGQLQHEIDTLKQELSSIKQSLMVALGAAQL